MQAWLGGKSCFSNTNAPIRDRLLFIAGGRGVGGFGAKEGDILADSPFQCYWSDPPNNFW